MSKSSIAAENSITQGSTPDAVWDLSGPASTNIEGFATEISVNSDGTETVKLKISTNSASYRIDIYRMGYYQGNGARLVATSVAPGRGVGVGEYPAHALGTTGAGRQFIDWVSRCGQLECVGLLGGACHRSLGRLHRAFGASGWDIRREPHPVHCPR